MEINFTISREEFLNFHMNHITETKDYKHAIIGNNVFMFLCLFLVFIISKHSYYTISVFILWLIFLLFRKKYMLYRLRRKLHKIFSFSKYDNYFENTILIIDNYGLNLSTSLSQKSYKWDALKNLYLIDNFIFIRTSTHVDILIPIYSFITSESKEFFINSIINNTKLELKNKYPIDFKYQ